MNTAENEKMIEEFVRGPLGCNCPAKVFEQIEQIDSPAEFEDLASTNLVKIGGLLLLLTLKVDDWQQLQSQLESIFKRGINLRDSIGYSRFRLVVATADAKHAEQSLKQQFDTFSELDEKIHLHVITPEELPYTNIH